MLAPGCRLSRHFAAQGKRLKINEIREEPGLR